MPTTEPERFAASGTRSLAATFPPFVPPRLTRPYVAMKSAQAKPKRIRVNAAIRHLAMRGGAMEPEGATLEARRRVQLYHTIDSHLLAEMLETLWAFRLHWWKPSDTLYLHYDRVKALVATNTHRPEDARSFIPKDFAKRQTPEDLSAFRAGTYTGRG